MSQTKADYWEDLNKWFLFALHQLLYVPACCIHAIEQELKTRHDSPKSSHRPPLHSESRTIDHFEAAKQSKDHLEKATIADQPHICRSCGDDIITRVHSNHAHEHTRVDNDTFHDWLANDQPHLDLYEAMPHVSAFEQNLEGFNEEHLQRIERYWAEHQLASPNCAATAKAAKLATVADWEKTKRLSLEENERLQRQ